MAAMAATTQFPEFEKAVIDSLVEDDFRVLWGSDAKLGDGTYATKMGTSVILIVYWLNYA